MFARKWVRALKSIVLVNLLIANVTAQAEQAPLLAAASSLRTLWPDLMKAYRSDTGETEPRVSFGSSGLLSTQIVNGAPFDVFLSADRQSIDRIPGHRLVGVPQIFALGALSLAVPADSPLASGLSMSSVAQAATPDTDHASGHSAEQRNTDTGFRIAIPNPLHAPYGRAAQEALEHSGIWPLPAGSMLAAENASQTLQFIKTGAVDAALLPTILIKTDDHSLVTIAVPPQSYQSVEHVVAQLGDPENSATLFSRWMLSPVAQRVLQQAGLQMAP